MTRDDMIADVLATVEEEKGFPGSDLTDVKGGCPEPVVRFRWSSGAWLAYVLDVSGVLPWPEDRPWPAFAVDTFVSGGGRLVPAQLQAYRARPCQLHMPDNVESCGCPTMYEVLAGEMRRRSEAKLKEIAAAAETAKPDPPTPSASAAATADATANGATATTGEPGLLWTFRCLDCGRTELLPSVPPGRGEACPECGHAGVFLHRTDQHAPPHASYADVIVADGVLEEPGGGACYVCGGPLASPGGKCARLRGGFVRAHLACVQEKRAKTSRGVAIFVRVGDPKGYCHACKAPFRAQELTILGGKAHALYSLCQAGPTPPAVAPAGRSLGRAMKEPCVVCGQVMAKGHVVAGHLDGTAHMLCITVPEKLPQSFDAGTIA